MELKNQITCKECGGKAKVDISIKYLSNPPKYDAICENCGHRFYVREPDLIIKPGEELGTLKIKKFHKTGIDKEIAEEEKEIAELERQKEKIDRLRSLKRRKKELFEQVDRYSE